MEETFYQNEGVSQGQGQVRNLEKGTQCKERGEHDGKGHLKTVLVRQALRATAADRHHTQLGVCSSGAVSYRELQLPVSPEGSSFSCPPLGLAL